MQEEKSLDVKHSHLSVLGGNPLRLRTCENLGKYGTVGLLIEESWHSKERNLVP